MVLSVNRVSRIGRSTHVQVAHCGPNVDRMNTTKPTVLERELGLAISDEVKRQGMTAKALQAAAGINDKTYRRYFVAGERHIPIDQVEPVANALGVPLSTLVARAEAAVREIQATDAAKAAGEIKGLTPAERADLERAIASKRGTGRQPSTPPEPKVKRTKRAG